MSNDSLSKVIDQVFGHHENNFEGDRNIDTGTEVIIIELDELLCGFNSPFVQKDIVNKERGFGDISFCYSRVVHPIICELFNGSISDNPESTTEQLNYIINWRFNDDAADHILKSAQQKVWEVMNTSRKLIEVNSEDVVRFCITMLDNVLGRITDSARDYARGVSNNAYIQLDQRTTTSLNPPHNPNFLMVTVTYGWMYM